MEAGNESLGFSQCVLPASHTDGPCSVLGGSHVERGEQHAGHAPACKEPCLQEVLPAELPGAAGVLAGEGIHSWGSGIEPQSLHPYMEVYCCAWSCGAPCQLPTMLRLNFPNPDP